MKIVILDGYTANPGDLSWKDMEGLGEVTVYDRTAPALTAQRMQGAEVVFTNKTVISDEIMAQCPELKFIGVLATGVNIVDLEAAKARKIVVSNVPAYSTDSVAQFTIALLLELAHHVGAHSDAVMRGEWSCSADFCFWNYPLIELKGKTMGIIGFGKIGQATARIALALGMKVAVFGHHGISKEYLTEGIESVTLDELYQRSDVISLHCPLTNESRGMICNETIRKMKDGVLLINTARGALICEDDLKAALNSGKVGGAAVDVVETEPLRTDSPLMKAKNIIITPHIAWAPKEARERLLDIAVENLRAYINGSPIHVVNG